MRIVRPLVILAAAIALAASPSHAAGSGTRIGMAAGALIPERELADFNETSYYISSRSIYGDKLFGGRASAYYGDTTGSNGAAGGRVYGFDVAAVLKFGGPSSYGYVFAGAGYGNMTFTNGGATPGSRIRRSQHDWCWTGGVGVTINKKVYLEASYVSYQTDPQTTDYIPVVIGFEF